MVKLTGKEINDELLKYGYYAENDLLYRVILGLLKINRTYVNPAQDIYALCLDGPPGAGKTKYAKVYTKILKSLYGEDQVSFIGYQCDPTTGKTELYEDLNIVATVVDKDRDKIIIPGVIARAIKTVNEGKKVVLFLDEYDKAREETDSFLLQFLQDGKINTTQYGDMEIKEEYKNNLQVILCKNDVRKDLSNQFYRRVHMIRLDYMRPDLFYQVAQRQMLEDRQINNNSIEKDSSVLTILDDIPKNALPVSEEVINLVSLMYQNAYLDRDGYMKLPSTSEMLIAIEEVDDLIKYSDASQAIIYNILINDLFKYEDDIKTFERSTSTKKDKNAKKLKNVIDNMKKKNDNSFEDHGINQLIADNIFKDQTAKYKEKIDQLDGLITKYEDKFKKLEETKKKQIEEELSAILIGETELMGTQDEIKTIGNFCDESLYLKRGISVFSLDDEWCDVGYMYLPIPIQFAFINMLSKNSCNYDIVAYEDGFLISSDLSCEFIMVRDYDNDNKVRFRFLSNNIVSPASVISNINNLVNIALNASNNNIALAKSMQERIKDDSKIKINIDSFLYNEDDAIMGVGIDKVEGFDNLYSGNFFVDTDVSSWNDKSKDGLAIVERVKNTIKIQEVEKFKNIIEKLKQKEVVKVKK